MAQLVSAQPTDTLEGRVALNPLEAFRAAIGIPLDAEHAVGIRGGRIPHHVYLDVMLYGQHLYTGQRTPLVIGHGSTQVTGGGCADHIGCSEDSFVGLIRKCLCHVGRQWGQWCTESAMRKEVPTSVRKSLIWWDMRVHNTHGIVDRRGRDRRRLLAQPGAPGAGPASSSSPTAR